MSTVMSTTTTRHNSPYALSPEDSRGPGVDWRHSAACAEESPELFFPIGEGGPALTQLDQAKQVCQGCLVRQACLHWALREHEVHGVWGGLSETERKRLHRRTIRP